MATVLQQLFDDVERKKPWVFVLDADVKMRLCYMYCTLCFAWLWIGQVLRGGIC